MKKAALYIRASKSTLTKSIETQREELLKYCKEHDCEVTEIYEDLNSSSNAPIEERKEYMRMLNDVNKSKFDIILFTKTAIISRDVLGFDSFVKQMNEMPWRAILDDYGTDTPLDKFRFEIMWNIFKEEDKEEEKEE